MVVATDRYVAEDAVERIGSSTSSRPPVVGVEAARARPSTPVHDDVPGNVAAHMVQEVGRRDGRDRRGPAPAVAGPARSSAAPRCRWRARACYARWDADDRSLRVYTSTQTSTSVRQAIAAKLELPVDRVEVSPRTSAAGSA